MTNASLVPGSYRRHRRRKSSIKITGFHGDEDTSRGLLGCKTGVTTQ